jgi:branched-chain amino acid transport system permease protein
MIPKISFKNLFKPDAFRSPWKLALYFIGGVLVISLPLLKFQQEAFWVRVVGYTGLYIILGLGLNLQVGLTGLLDLGYVAFYAIGAYTYVLPLAAVLAGFAGVLLGIPVLRMRGDYLAIVTLAFGEIVRILATNLKGLTNGSQGIVGIDPPVLFGLQLKTGTHFYYLILVFLIVTIFFVSRLNRSRIGRTWTALREDEDVAQMMGINTTTAKLLSFGLGAMIGGVGGAVFSAWQSSIFPDNFNLLVSINVLCLVIIGGMGSIPGVVLGAVALITLPDILRQFSDYRMLLFGLLLIVMMIARPDGFIPAKRPPLEAQNRIDTHRQTDTADEGAEQ